MNATAKKGKKAKDQKPAAPTAEISENAPPPRSPGEFAMVSMDLIDAAPNNHRGNAQPDDDSARELAASLASIGLKQPIRLLRHGTRYQVVFGHRRLQAARILGWDTIPAFIADSIDISDAVLERAAENLQRRDLNPIEEAVAVAELLDAATEGVRVQFGYKPEQTLGVVAADVLRREAVNNVARRLGKLPAWVRDRYFLGTLDPTTRGLVVEGRLPMEHARELAKILDHDERARLAKLAASNPTGSPSREQPSTLRDVRTWVAREIRNLAGVPWKLDAEFAGAPACFVCPANSRNQTGLFEATAGKQPSRYGTAMSEGEAGICLNSACFGRKSGTANRQISTAARRVQVTVSATTPANRKQVKADAMKAIEAPVVRPGILKSRVAEKVGFMIESAAGQKSGATSSAPKSRAETPETVAKRNLEAALLDWGSSIEKAIKKSGEVDGVTELLLHALEDTSVFGDTLDEGAPGTKARERVKQIVARIVSDPDKTLVMLAEEKRPKYMGSWGDEWHEDCLETFANELGVKIEKPRPTLDDFMPKPKGKDMCEVLHPGKKLRGAKGGTKPKARELAAAAAGEED